MTGSKSGLHDSVALKYTSRSVYVLSKQLNSAEQVFIVDCKIVAASFQKI